jgi:hypothetical protein
MRSPSRTIFNVAALELDWLMHGNRFDAGRHDIDSELILAAWPGVPAGRNGDDTGGDT